MLLIRLCTLTFLSVLPAYASTQNSTPAETRPASNPTATQNVQTPVKKQLITIKWIHEEKDKKNPNFKSAVKQIGKFWKTYSNKDWEKLYQLETQGVRETFTQPIYIGNMRAATPPIAITLYGPTFEEADRARVRVEFEYDNAVDQHRDMPKKSTLTWDWHKSGNKWLRDYRVPVIRP